MPVMDGFYAFDEIRRRSKSVKIPIVAVTAKIAEEDRKQILNYGFNDYIPKPIDEKILLEVLRKFLNG